MLCAVLLLIHAATNDSFDQQRPNRTTELSFTITNSYLIPDSFIHSFIPTLCINVLLLCSCIHFLHFLHWLVMYWLKILKYLNIYIQYKLSLKKNYQMQVFRVIFNGSVYFSKSGLTVKNCFTQFLLECTWHSLITGLYRSSLF